MTMTQEEFFEEMEKIKSSLIPGHSKACACLQGNDHNIELVRSDVGVETAIGVMVKWCKEPASCIDLLLRFPKLKSLFFFYGADRARRVIRRSWEGLSKLKNLESLRIQDCVLLTNEALEEISKLSSLRNLEIINRLDEGLDFSVLGKLKNLRRLELKAGSHHQVKDLAFVQELPNLEVLCLDENKHLDLSKLVIPENVKYIEVPTCAAEELQAHVGEKYQVVIDSNKRKSKGCCCFVRSDVENAWEAKKEQERQFAFLKYTFENMKSAMEQLMSEPLIPELGKGHIVQMNAHLLELEKILQEDDGNVRSKQ